MSVEIREARPDEHEEAGRVAMAAYDEFFAPGSEDEDHRYHRHIGDVAGRADRTTILAAIEDGALVGTLTLELEGRIGDKDGNPPLAPGEAHIRMLGVAPTARRRGIARALMVDAEARARAAGKTFVTLNTTHLMEAAQTMYRSMGYVRVEDEVLPDGFVLLGFRKDL
ncbi:MAG TPA: GNAT family N-acetyltransferase [Actinomycetota bacterium]